MAVGGVPYSAPMNLKHPLAVAVATTLFACEVLAADLVPLEWNADGRFAKELTLPASGFVEVCGKLSAKTQVHWQFDASAPLNFNVHFHEGKKVHFPAKQDQVKKAADVLLVKLDQDYCWMWTNKARREATLKLDLRKG